MLQKAGFEMRSCKLPQAVAKSFTTVSFASLELNPTWGRQAFQSTSLLRIQAATDSLSGGAALQPVFRQHQNAQGETAPASPWLRRCRFVERL